MSSIFDLKTNPSQLESSNNGTSRMAYEQLAPTRDVTGNNFPNGSIHFQFETSGGRWWIPNRSYLRMRCKLTKADGTQLHVSDNIAPNMDLCAALFQSLEFRIAGKTVSRVADYVPQVDVIEKRLSQSKGVLDSIGYSSNFMSPYFDSRQADISKDGVLNEHVSRPVTVATRAQLLFDEAGGSGVDRNAVTLDNSTGLLTFSQNGGQALGDVRAGFPVGSSYIRFDTIQGAAANDERVGRPLKIIEHISTTQLRVEANRLNGDITADGRTDFVRLTLETKSFQSPQARKISDFELCWQPPLSLFKVVHALPAGKYEMVLNPQSSSVYQKAAIESFATSKTAGTDFKFEVTDMYFYVNTIEGSRCDDLTYLLDLETTRAQAEDISSASFGQRNFDVSPSTYALTTAFQDLRCQSDTRFAQTRLRSYDATGYIETGLSLNRFYISYDGQQLPSPDASPQFTNAVDFTNQRYIETQMYTGAFYDTGGAETIGEWHERGAYYYFSWPRDGMSRATRVNVHTGFASGTDISNTRLLLFDHSRQVAKIQIVDGRVVDVMCEDA